MGIMARSQIHDGLIKVWEFNGNTGDYMNINIAKDIPIHKVSQIKVYTVGGFSVERTKGELPQTPQTTRISPYCSLSKELPFETFNAGELKFTAIENGSRWFCISHHNFKPISGDTFELKAGESVTVPSDSYIFVAIGDVNTTSKGNVSIRTLFLTQAEEIITAITDCMVLRIDNVPIAS